MIKTEEMEVSIHVVMVAMPTKEMQILKHEYKTTE